MAEHQAVALGVVGSNPIAHPSACASPSSRGLGLGIFDPATGVRIPLGTQRKNGKTRRGCLPFCVLGLCPAPNDPAVSDSPKQSRAHGTAFCQQRADCACRFPTVYRRLPTAYRQLPTAYCLLQTATCHLLSPSHRLRLNFSNSLCISSILFWSLFTSSSRRSSLRFSSS